MSYGDYGEVFNAGGFIKETSNQNLWNGGVLKFQSTICTGLSSTIVWRGLNRRWNSSSSRFCWFFCVSRRYHGSETSSANWKDSWQTEKTGFLEWRYGKMGVSSIMYLISTIGYLRMIGWLEMSNGSGNVFFLQPPTRKQCAWFRQNLGEWPTSEMVILDGFPLHRIHIYIRV